MKDPARNIKAIAARHEVAIRQPEVLADHEAVAIARESFRQVTAGDRRRVGEHPDLAAVVRGRDARAIRRPSDRLDLWVLGLAAAVAAALTGTSGSIPTF